jgi:hypothetical protein
MKDQRSDAVDEFHGLSDVVAPVVLMTVVLLVFIGLSILWWPTPL